MAQTLGAWYMMPDSTTENTYNLVPHNVSMFMSGYGLYYFFVHYWVSEGWAVFAVIMLIGCFEIMHALIPTATVQAPLGGDGFSYYKLIYGVGGMLIGLILDLIWPPSIRMPLKKREFYQYCYDYPDAEECVDVEIPEKWFRLYGPQDEDVSNLSFWF